MKSTSQTYQLSPMKRQQSQQVAKEIASMSRYLIERGLGWNWRPKRIMRNLQRDDTIVLIAHQDRRMLGFGIMRYHESQAHLLLLGVKPDAQRQGVGKALMTWLEACARADGATHIILEVLARNEAGRAFYNALGYKLLYDLPRYYGGRVRGLRLHKQLTPAPAPSEPAEQPPVEDLLPQLNAQIQQHTAQLKASFVETLTAEERWLWEARIDTEQPISLFALQQQAQEEAASKQEEPPDIVALKRQEAALNARWSHHCRRATTERQST